ncbi:hypothetical protein ACJX0J_037656, partial [Zea mays]
HQKKEKKSISQTRAKFGDTSYRQNEVEADVEEIYQEIEPDSVAGDLNDVIVPPKRKRKYNSNSFILFNMGKEKMILQTAVVNFHLYNLDSFILCKYNSDSFILFNMGKEKNDMFIIYYLHPNQK